MDPKKRQEFIERQITVVVNTGIEKLEPSFGVQDYGLVVRHLFKCAEFQYKRDIPQELKEEAVQSFLNALQNSKAKPVLPDIVFEEPPMPSAQNKAAPSKFEIVQPKVAEAVTPTKYSTPRAQRVKEIFDEEETDNDDEGEEERRVAEPKNKKRKTSTGDETVQGKKVKVQQSKQGSSSAGIFSEMYGAGKKG